MVQNRRTINCVVKSLCLFWCIYWVYWYRQKKEGGVQLRVQTLVQTFNPKTCLHFSKHTCYFNLFLCNSFLFILLYRLLPLHGLTKFNQFFIIHTSIIWLIACFNTQFFQKWFIRSSSHFNTKLIDNAVVCSIRL